MEERPEIFDINAYNKAINEYYDNLEKYHNKNWLMKLFSEKPIRPKYEDFLIF